MEKHLIYHQLMDCLNDDVCPVCTLINKSIDRFIDGFLYESVNDFKLREEIAKSKGYCNYHAWRLQKAGDPLAHAIIYEGLINNEIKDIENCIKDLEGSSKIKRTLGGAKHKREYNGRYKQLFEPDGQCPLCVMVEDSEDMYLTSFYACLQNDSELKNKFREHGYLCNTHLNAFLQLSDDADTIREVLEKQKATLTKLSKDLSEIKRKSDYRYSGETLTDNEKVAWIKAVKLMTGEPGIQR